ncbi:MAG: SPOR domain-containing protein [Candidatus Omnitrophica bacterium]|nr:SPOR domain-containing protein [Candidatus Omnitrophota bacterium]
MAFWKNAKKDSLKVLTEKEIRERLYGVSHDTGVPAAKTVFKAGEATKENVPSLIEKDLFQTEVTPPADAVKHEGAVDEAVGPVVTPPAEKKDEASSRRAAQVKDEDLRARAKELELRFEEEAKSIEERPIEEYFPFAKPRKGISLEPAVKFFGILGNVARRLKGLPINYILLIAGSVAGFVIVFNVVSNIALKRDVELGVPLEKKAENSLSSQVVKGVSKPGKAESQPQASKQPVSVKGRYTVQICVYQNEDGAKLLVKDLCGKKLIAFYDSFVIRQGRKMFRVCVGRYDTFQEAEKALQVFRGDPRLKDFKDSFVHSVASSAS